jgi:hypothetical protein
MYRDGHDSSQGSRRSRVRTGHSTLRIGGKLGVNADTGGCRAKVLKPPELDAELVPTEGLNHVMTYAPADRPQTAATTGAGGSISTRLDEGLGG